VPGWCRRAWADITRATSARLHHGRWHISFTTPPADKITADTGAVVGMDRGVKNTLATSDGQMLQAPTLTEREQARFVRLQRQLARQQKGSRRREQTLGQLAVLRRRLEDRRTDWVEQTTTALARTHDYIAVEDLNVRGMVRRPAPKPDPDQPGRFLRNGARAKASRTCAACGHVAADNRESQAVFACQACGHEAHADTNAAVVILDRVFAPTAAGHAVSGRVSPPSSGGSANPRAA
jgi:putative transposase